MFDLARFYPEADAEANAIGLGKEVTVYSGPSRFRLFLYVLAALFKKDGSWDLDMIFGLSEVMRSEVRPEPWVVKSERKLRVLSVSFLPHSREVMIDACDFLSFRSCRIKYNPHLRTGKYRETHERFKVS